ncbi:MAG TPA: phosphoribosylaminoimidazole carboxylase, partial [Methanothrix soehngenii]|nr:phosphoribosylaminoimidazole carboxylase [Methanothrix soehngenii]
MESNREILESYRRGEISLEEALKQIRVRDYRTVGEVAKLDICRSNRIGIPEAILAEGKDKSDLLAISLAHLEETGSVIITR